MSRFLTLGFFLLACEDPEKEIVDIDVDTNDPLTGIENIVGDWTMIQNDTETYPMLGHTPENSDGIETYTGEGYGLEIFATPDSSGKNLELIYVTSQTVLKDGEIDETESSNVSETKATGTINRIDSEYNMELLFSATNVTSNYSCTVDITSQTEGSISCTTVENRVTKVVEYIFEDIEKSVVNNIPSEADTGN